MTFPSFIDCIEFLKKFKLTNRQDYEKFRIKDKGLNNLPCEPNNTYKKEATLKWGQFYWFLFLNSNKVSTFEEKKLHMTFQSCINHIEKQPNINTKDKYKEHVKLYNEKQLKLTILNFNKDKKDILLPTNPDIIYKDDAKEIWGGFIWCLFIKTNKISNSEMKYFFMSLEKILGFLKDKQLSTKKDYVTFVKKHNEKYSQIILKKFNKNTYTRLLPTSPKKVYEKEATKLWGQFTFSRFLNTNIISNHEKNETYMSFNESLSHLKNIRLFNRKEYIEYAIEYNTQNNKRLPLKPWEIYKEEAIEKWGDFYDVLFFQSEIINQNSSSKLLLCYKDSLSILSDKKLKKRKDYEQFRILYNKNCVHLISETKNIYKFLPYNPTDAYKGDWVSWSLFLNTSHISNYEKSKLICPIFEATLWCLDNNVNTMGGYMKKTKQEKFPVWLPKDPSDTYKKRKTWVSIPSFFSRKSLKANLQKIKLQTTYKNKTYDNNQEIYENDNPHIYSYTLLSGKKYIGLSHNVHKRRFIEHCRDSYYMLVYGKHKQHKSLLDNSIVKQFKDSSDYDEDITWEDFIEYISTHISVEIIEEVNVENIKEKEIFYIKKFETNRRSKYYDGSNGLNLNEGGGGFTTQQMKLLHKTSEYRGKLVALKKYKLDHNKNSLKVCITPMMKEKKIIGYRYGELINNNFYLIFSSSSKFSLDEKLKHVTNVKEMVTNKQLSHYQRTEIINKYKKYIKKLRVNIKTPIKKRDSAKKDHNNKQLPMYISTCADSDGEIIGYLFSREIKEINYRVKLSTVQLRLDDKLLKIKKIAEQIDGNIDNSSKLTSLIKNFKKNNVYKGSNKNKFGKSNKVRYDHNGNQLPCNVLVYKSNNIICGYKVSVNFNKKSYGKSFNYTRLLLDLDDCLDIAVKYKKDLCNRLELQ